MKRFDALTEAKRRGVFVKLGSRMFVSQLSPEEQISFSLRLYLRLASFSENVPIYTVLLNEAFLAPCFVSGLKIDFRT